MVGDWYSLALSALAVWAVIFSIYVVSERRSPASTISWILTLGFMPLVGFVVYYFLGPRRFDRKIRRRVQAHKAVNRVLGTKEAQDAQDQTLARKRGAAGFLVDMNRGALGLSAHLRTADLTLYLAGIEKYAALMKDIAAAQHHINIEYYIWEPDQIGTRLRDALVQRAAAGVAVRLHVDGVGSAQANKRFWLPLSRAGAKIVHFNKFALRRRNGNFRTHRKIVVIDGRVAYCGGMNITDIHTSEFSGEGAWRDTHLRLEGAAARGLQMVFNEGWFDSTREILDGTSYFPEPDLANEGEHSVQIVSSGPNENRNAIHKLLASSVFASAERVYLTTPYFVPDPTTFDALTAAALRGVDVRILVPHKNDLKVIGAASRSFYPDLLDMGVRVFEYVPTMVHSKTLVVDNMLAVVGTANADNRSFRLNFEVVVANYDGQLCDTLARAFERDLEQSKEVTIETIEAYSRTRRLGQSFARLISPLL